MQKEGKKKTTIDFKFVQNSRHVKLLINIDEYSKIKMINFL